jgi:putative protein-disulfide isomerase
MGGLAPDSDEPMDLSMRSKLQSIWHHIEENTGTEFNHQFWKVNSPRRSTYPACRAVIAAGMLEPDSIAKMITAIQHAYYLNAKNPSDISVLVECAELIGLDAEAFKRLITSDEINEKLSEHLNASRNLGIGGFPALLLNDGTQLTPLALGYSTLEKLEARFTK